MRTIALVFTLAACLAIQPAWANGSRSMQVADEEAYLSSWGWSPDGQWIAFVADWQGYLMDAEGQRLRQFTDAGRLYSKNWSPNSEWVGFYAGEGGSDSFLLVDPHGGMPSRIVDVEFDSLNWSPDGDRIGLAYWPRDEGGDWVYDVVSDRLVDLKTYFPEFNLIRFLSWSPDGQRMLFLAGADRDHVDIFTANTDGSDPRNLTNDPADYLQSIEWSPDGQWIVVDGYISGHDQMFLAPADGSGVHDLTASLAENSNNAYASPSIIAWVDSTRMLVQTYGGGEGNDSLLVVDVNGNILHHVFEGGLPQGSKVAVSPDGTNAAVALNYNHNDLQASSDIFLLDLADFTLRQVTDTPLAYGSFVQWSPDSQKMYIGFFDTFNDFPEFAVIDADENTLHYFDLVDRLSDEYWSPDSRYLLSISYYGQGIETNGAYVVDSDGGNLRSLSVNVPVDTNCEAGQEPVRLDPDSGYQVIGWSPDSRRIFIHGGAFGCIIGFSVIEVEEIEMIPTVVPD